MTGPLQTRVPVARRALFADRRRGVLTVAGVAASLLLVLALDAIFAGAIRRVTFYIRTSPADVFVSQQGVRTMHMSSSAIPNDTETRATAVPGVEWAAPIGFAAGTSLVGPDGRQLSYLIGYDTRTGHGGPSKLIAGRPPGAGEVVVDRLGANQLGLRLGGTATVLGAPLRVVGLAAGGTSITNTTVFVSHQQYRDMRGPTAAYLLVKARPGVSAGTLAARLRLALPDLAVQTRQQFANSEARIVSDMSADLIRLMALIGLLISLAVIALGLLTTTMSRLRDYAVLKALGASSLRLSALVTAQAGWIVVLALATATLAALALGRVIPSLTPSVQMTVTGTSVIQAGIAALAVGLLAALLPLRRLATLDAATAFREAR